MLESLFYIFTLVPIFWEIYVLRAPTEHLVFAERMKVIEAELKKDRELEDLVATNYEMKKITTQSLVNLLYLIWAIIGLFTSQSFLFILLWLIGLIKLKIKTRYVIVLDSTLSLLVLFGIYLNKMVFHVDFYQQILGWF